MVIDTVFFIYYCYYFLANFIVIIFSHWTRWWWWWWWYSSILLKGQIHIYMYSKLDITVMVTIPKTVLQSSAGCTLWLKVELHFPLFFLFSFFFFSFFLSCGLSDGDLVVSFICFIRNCWNHSQCLWVLWLQYCVDCGSQKWSSWVGVRNTTNIFDGCGNFKFWTQWLSYIRCWSNTSECDFFFDTVEFEFEFEVNYR